MHARTQPTLLSQRGDFITSISTADSAAGALINRHFTSFILSNRERGCCCAAAQNACVRVCSQTNVWRKMNQPMTPRAYAIAPPWSSFHLNLCILTCLCPSAAMLPQNQSHTRTHTHIAPICSTLTFHRMIYLQKQIQQENNTFKIKRITTVISLINQWSRKLACHVGSFSFTRGKKQG